LSFETFLSRFKSDRSFQISRISFSPRATETGPQDERSTRRMSRTEVKALSGGVLVADPAATNSGDRETDV
jgi:hypothetical protein